MAARDNHFAFCAKTKTGAARARCVAMLLSAMGRPQREPPSPTWLVPALLAFVRARGGDASLLALRFGLDADVEGRPDAPISASGLGELLAAASEELAEPFLALRLPAELPRARYGHAELVARTSDTVRDALQNFARYASLVLPRLEGALTEEGTDAHWNALTHNHPRGVGRHSNEYALALVLEHCRTESGQSIHPSRVWFQHARPRELAPLHRFFATEDLEFGRETNGFTLPRSSLDWPMRAKDPRLLVAVSELADAALRAQPRSQDLAALVTEKIRASLDDASTESVAKALHMSPRTLQRRLRGEATEFSALLDGVREAVAREEIKQREIPLSEIARRLGFADLATFSRAFKRWTGKPPGALRP